MKISALPTIVLCLPTIEILWESIGKANGKKIMKDSDYFIWKISIFPMSNKDENTL